MSELPPGLLLILGALLVPLLRGRLRAVYMLVLPLLGLLQLLSLPMGSGTAFGFLGMEVQPTRVDGLSLPFGIIFYIGAFLLVVYALHVRDPVQHVAGLSYAGAAIGAVFAGDLLTFFVYWELTALTSVFLILARRTGRSFRAGMRYLVFQITSGLLLLSGIIVLAAQGSSMTFGALPLQGVGPVLIFLAIGIKCAFPLLHSWLADAYPEATETGTVFLSTFTTKLAVYALARGFAGTEILVPIGVAMMLFPLLYMAVENDLRRVLAWGLNNQLGFMVVGVGIGSGLALNGTVAHAFTHILYEGLLFMAMGAVLHRAGTIQARELGGLWRSMPYTAAFCIVGAASISAVPLFSGFVSKSMIITAAADGHWTLAWLALLFASAGVLLFPAIKVSYYAFFGTETGRRYQEAPGNMLVAMALASLLSIGIGLYPEPLYRLLPHAASYAPYTATHILTQLQLLLFAGLAFALLQRFGLLPALRRRTNLDVDWLYRRFVPRLIAILDPPASRAWHLLLTWGHARVSQALASLFRHHGPEGILARSWPTGSMVLWAAALLGASLLLFYT